jgi:alanine racemase
MAEGRISVGEHEAKRPRLAVDVPEDVRSHAPARALINLAAIRHNVRLLQASASDLGSSIMGVIKADGYGHGAVQVARTMVDCGVDAFAVATLVEAVELRCAGIDKATILVLGAPIPGDIPVMASYRLDLMVSSVEVAERVGRVAKSLAPGQSLNVHIYIETGMMRLGLKPNEVTKGLDALESVDRVHLVGVCTHFAEADDPHSEFVVEQLRKMDEALAAVHKHPLYTSPIHIPYLHKGDIAVHISNSAALLDARFHELLRKYKASYVRPGVALYGFYPEVAHRRSDHVLGEPADAPRRVWVKDLAVHEAVTGQLEEAMTFVAKVVNIMEVDKGETVGYSRTFTAPQKCRIATLGVGYADGYPRSASRKSQVAIRGRYYPIAGNVCMDMVMVNLGDAESPGKEVEIGDDAILFGPGGITAGELAWHCDTIHYEILTGVQKRVLRVYVDDETGVRDRRRQDTTPRGQVLASLLYDDQDAH